MSLTNVRIVRVPARFNREMMLGYLTLFHEALSARKKLFIYATPEAREKFRACAKGVFTDGELSMLEFHGYPTSQVQAMNIARGTRNAFMLFIDEVGRYTDIILPSLIAANPAAAKIVSLTADVER